MYFPKDEILEVCNVEGCINNWSDVRNYDSPDLFVTPDGFRRQTICLPDF